MADHVGLVTTRELAQRLHVTEGTVRRWRREGRVTPAVLTGRHLWDMDDVIDALNVTAAETEGAAQ